MMSSSPFINRNFFTGIIFLLLTIFLGVFSAYFAFKWGMGIFGFIIFLPITLGIPTLANYQFENWRLKKLSKRFQQFVQEQPVAFSFAITNGGQKGNLLITEKSINFLPKKGNPICISYEVLLHHSWDVVHLCTDDSVLFALFHEKGDKIPATRLVLESINKQLSHDRVTFYFQPNKKFKEAFNKYVYTTSSSLAVNDFKSTENSAGLL